MQLWYKELKEQSSPDIKIILVGNKNDLSNKRAVKEDEVQKLIKEYDIDYYIETSAKTGENVEKLFVEASKILYKEYMDITKNQKKKNKKEQTINIQDLDIGNEESKCWC